MIILNIIISIGHCGSMVNPDLHIISIGQWLNGTLIFIYMYLELLNG